MELIVGLVNICKTQLSQSISTVCYKHRYKCSCLNLWIVSQRKH